MLESWLWWQNTFWRNFIAVSSETFLSCIFHLCLLHLISHPCSGAGNTHELQVDWIDVWASSVPRLSPTSLPPVIMQALSWTHANYERHAQHHLPNYGRERAPSSASLHPDLSGGHLAQVALLQGGPPGPRGRPHHQSEELRDISIPAPQYGQDACITVWWGRNHQLFFLFTFGSKIGWILNP